MNGCPRHFCVACDQEMIHRDNRHTWESSSTIGQIISRDGPRTFTFADLDGVIRLWLGQRDGRTLLRLIEHKQPTAKFKDPQKQVLRDLAALLNHALGCPSSPMRLHPESGLFVIYGPVSAEETDHRKTVLAGPQRIYRIEHNGAEFYQHGVSVTRSHDELFRWLTAGLDGERRVPFWPLRNVL